MKTEVILINPHTKSHRTAEESLALGYLASTLRKDGNSVAIIDGWLRNLQSFDIVDLIANQYNPSVICITCYRSNIDEVSLLISEIKSRLGDIPIVGGGYGPTFHDEDFLESGMDVVVRGEAECIIASMIESLVHGRTLSAIPGLSFKKDDVTVRTDASKSLVVLDDLPYPSRDELLLSMARKNPVHLCTSRGCNGYCSFCSVNSFYANAKKRERWRQRYIKNIVDEIEYLYQKFGARSFKFVDDSFLEPPRDEKWSYDFANEILKRNLRIKFRTQIRSDRLTLPMAKNLKSCGWFATSIGIENFANSSLKRMGKGASCQNNLQALDILNECEILTQVGLIMFDPHTTMEELRENCEILCRYNWVITKGIFTEMFAADGTAFTNKLIKTGKLQTAPNNQNRCYEVKNSLARRAYSILKKWHKSHAQLYDWVVDSVAAPKVMSAFGYKSVHSLCSQLLAVDLEIFRKSVDHIRSMPEKTDREFVELQISSKRHIYSLIKAEIERIYAKEGLCYDGILNPFL